MAMPILEEVPEHERRFGTAAGASKPVEEPKAEKVLVGTRQGVGGVIEAVQKKYNMQKGQRAKVVAETKELWKMEGDLNVPKVHMNKGWRWVLQGDDQAAKKKAEEQALKKQEKEEAEKRKRNEERHRKVEPKSDDVVKGNKHSAKDHKSSRSKKKRGGSSNSLSNARSSPSRG